MVAPDNSNLGDLARLDLARQKKPESKVETKPAPPAAHDPAVTEKLLADAQPKPQPQPKTTSSWSLSSLYHSAYNVVAQEVTSLVSPTPPTVRPGQAVEQHKSTSSPLSALNPVGMTETLAVQVLDAGLHYKQTYNSAVDAVHKFQGLSGKQQASVGVAGGFLVLGGLALHKPAAVEEAAGLLREGETVARTTAEVEKADLAAARAANRAESLLLVPARDADRALQDVQEGNRVIAANREGQMLPGQNRGATLEAQKPTAARTTFLLGETRAPGATASNATGGSWFKRNVLSWFQTAEPEAGAVTKTDLPKAFTPEPVRQPALVRAESVPAKEETHLPPRVEPAKIITPEPVRQPALVQAESAPAKVETHLPPRVEPAKIKAAPEIVERRIPSGQGEPLVEPGKQAPPPQIEAAPPSKPVKPGGRPVTAATSEADLNHARHVHNLGHVSESASKVERDIAAIENLGLPAQAKGPLRAIAEEVRASRSAGRAPQPAVLANQIAELKKAAGTSKPEAEAVSRLEASLKEYESASATAVPPAQGAPDAVAALEKSRAAEGAQTTVQKARVEQADLPGGRSGGQLEETGHIAAGKPTPAMTNALAARTASATQLEEQATALRNVQGAPPAQVLDRIAADSKAYAAATDGERAVIGQRLTADVTEAARVMRQEPALAADAEKMEKQTAALVKSTSAVEQTAKFEEGVAKTMPSLSAQVAKLSGEYPQLRAPATEIEKLAKGAVTAENKPAAVRAIAAELTEAQKAVAGNAQATEALAPLREQIAQLERLGTASEGAVADYQRAQTAANEVQVLSAPERAAQPVRTGRVEANVGRVESGVDNAAQIKTPTPAMTNAVAARTATATQLEEQANALRNVQGAPPAQVLDRIAADSKAYAAATDGERAVIGQRLTQDVTEATRVMRQEPALAADAEKMEKQTAALVKSTSAVEQTAKFEEGVAKTMPSLSAQVAKLGGEYPQLRAPATEIERLAKGAVTAENKPAAVRAIAAELTEAQKAVAGNAQATEALAPLREQIAQLEKLGTASEGAVADYQRAQTAANEVQVLSAPERAAQPVRTGRVEANVGRVESGVDNAAQIKTPTPTPAMTNAVAARTATATQLEEQANALRNVQGAPPAQVLDRIAADSKAYAAATDGERAVIGQRLTQDVTEATRVMRQEPALAADAEKMEKQTAALVKSTSAVEQTAKFEEGVAKTMPSLSAQVAKLSGEYPQLRAPATEIEKLAKGAVTAENKPAAVRAIAAELTEAQKAVAGNAQATEALAPLREQIAQLEKLGTASEGAVADYQRAQTAANEVQVLSAPERAAQPVRTGRVEANVGRVESGVDNAAQIKTPTPTPAMTNAVAARTATATQLEEQATALRNVQGAPPAQVLDRIAADSKAYAAATDGERAVIGQRLTADVKEAARVMRQEPALAADAEKMEKQTAALVKSTTAVEETAKFEEGVAKTMPAVSKQAAELGRDYPQLRTQATEIQRLADGAVAAENKPAALQAISQQLTDAERIAAADTKAMEALAPLRQQVTELEKLGNASEAAVADYQRTQSAANEVQVLSAPERAAQTLRTGNVEGQTLQTERVVDNAAQTTTTPLTNASNAVAARTATATQLEEQANALRNVQGGPPAEVLDRIAADSKAYAAATDADRAAIGQRLTADVTEATRVMRQEPALVADAEKMEKQTAALVKSTTAVEETARFEEGVAKTMPAVSTQAAELGREYPQLRTQATEIQRLADGAVAAENKPAALQAISQQLTDAERIAAADTKAMEALAPLRQQVTELEKLGNASEAAVADYQRTQSAANEVQVLSAPERAAQTLRTGNVEGQTLQTERVVDNAAQTTTTPLTNASNAVAARTATATQLEEQANALRNVQGAPPAEVLDRIAADSKAYAAATDGERAVIGQRLTQDVTEATRVMRQEPALAADAEKMEKQTAALVKSTTAVEETAKFEEGVAKTMPAVSTQAAELGREYPQLRTQATEIQRLADGAVAAENKPAALQAISQQLTDAERIAAADTKAMEALAPLRQQVTELEKLGNASEAAVADYQRAQSAANEVQVLSAPERAAQTLRTGNVEGQTWQTERVVDNAAQTTTTPLTNASNAVAARTATATQLEEQANALRNVQGGPPAEVLDRIAADSKAYAAATDADRAAIGQRLTADVSEATRVMRQEPALAADAEKMEKQTAALVKSTTAVEETAKFEEGVAKTMPAVSTQAEELGREYPQLRAQATEIQRLADGAVAAENKPAALRAISQQLTDAERIAAADTKAMEALAPLRQQVTELEKLGNASEAAVADYQRAQSAADEVQALSAPERAAQTLRTGNVEGQTLQTERVVDNAAQTTTTPLTNASNAVAARTATATQLEEQANALRNVQGGPPAEVLDRIAADSKAYAAADADRALIGQRLTADVSEATRVMRNSGSEDLAVAAEKLERQSQALQQSANVAERMTQFEQGVSDASRDTAALRARMAQMDEAAADAGRANVAARSVGPRVTDSLDTIDRNLARLGTTENRAALLRQTMSEADKVETRLNAVGMETEAQALKQSMARVEALNSAAERAAVSEQSFNRVAESTDALRNDVREIASARETAGLPPLPEKAARAAQDIDAQLASGRPAALLDAQGVQALRNNTAELTTALNATGVESDAQRAMQVQARLVDVEQKVQTYNQIARVDNALTNVSQQTTNVLKVLGDIRGSQSGALNVSPELGEMERILTTMRANAAKSNDLENLQRLLDDAKLNEEQRAALTRALSGLNAASVSAAEERALLMQQQHSIVDGAFNVAVPAMVSPRALRDAEDANRVMRSVVSPDTHFANQLDHLDQRIANFRQVMPSDRPGVLAFENPGQRLLRLASVNDNYLSPVPLASRTDLGPDRANVFNLGGIRLTGRQAIGLSSAAAAAGVVAYTSTDAAPPAYSGPSLQSMRSGDAQRNYAGSSYLSADLSSARATALPGATSTIDGSASVADNAGPVVPNVLASSMASLAPTVQNLLLEPVASSSLTQAQGWAGVGSQFMGQPSLFNASIINLAPGQRIFAPLFSPSAVADPVAASRTQPFAVASGLTVTPNFVDSWERILNPRWQNPLLTGLKNRSPLDALHGDSDIGRHTTMAISGSPTLAMRGQVTTGLGGLNHDEVLERRTDSTQTNQATAAAANNQVLVTAALTPDPTTTQTNSTAAPMPNLQTLADSALRASAKQSGDEEKEQATVMT